ncbi:agmatinase [Cohnella faecalis]|uniref:agmatinase n=1 Tax=Cohnella faecalis TaxID=2315694 RepID=UPI001F2A322D|nr:agmatinase [Cohnella faecalis]
MTPFLSVRAPDSVRPHSRSVRRAGGIQPYLDRSIVDLEYFDAGDLLLPFGNAAKSLDIIAEFVRGVLDDGKIPVGLGGEHLVTWPVIQEVYKKYPDLAILHFDAHTDLREDYEGEPLSHSTPLRKAAELIGPSNVYQFGIRSGSKEDWTYAQQSGIHFHPFVVAEPLKSELPSLAGRPVYVTIDIDVLDPSAAPGTGTTEAGGITSGELLEAIHAIARSGVNVVGFDLVEVAPIYDPTEMTPIVASKMIREMLLDSLSKPNRLKSVPSNNEAIFLGLVAFGRSLF